MQDKSPSEEDFLAFSDAPRFNVFQPPTFSSPYKHQNRRSNSYNFTSSTSGRHHTPNRHQAGNRSFDLPWNRRHRGRRSGNDRSPANYSADLSNSPDSSSIDSCPATLSKRDDSDDEDLSSYLHSSFTEDPWARLERRTVKKCTEDVLEQSVKVEEDEEKGTNDKVKADV